jgi:hypothetical protein
MFDVRFQLLKIHHGKDDNVTMTVKLNTNQFVRVKDFNLRKKIDSSRLREIEKEVVSLPYIAKTVDVPDGFEERLLPLVGGQASLRVPVDALISMVAAMSKVDLGRAILVAALILAPLCLPVPARLDSRAVARALSWGDCGYASYFANGLYQRSVETEVLCGFALGEVPPGCMRINNLSPLQFVVAFREAAPEYDQGWGQFLQIGDRIMDVRAHSMAVTAQWIISSKFKLAAKGEVQIVGHYPDDPSWMDCLVTMVQHGGPVKSENLTSDSKRREVFDDYVLLAQSLLDYDSIMGYEEEEVIPVSTGVRRRGEDIVQEIRDMRKLTAKAE